MPLTRLLNHCQGDAMSEGQQVSSNLADQLMQLGRCILDPQGMQHLGIGQLEFAPSVDFGWLVIPSGW